MKKLIFPPNIMDAIWCGDKDIAIKMIREEFSISEEEAIEQLKLYQSSLNKKEHTETLTYLFVGTVILAVCSITYYMFS